VKWLRRRNVNIINGGSAAVANHQRINNHQAMAYQQ
jgi:hypothetical protein